MELFKMLSGSEIFAQILSFFLLLFLLKKFAWSKMLKLLDERRENIRSQLEEVENSRMQVERLKSDYELKISDIASQAQAEISRAVEQAKLVSAQIHKKAHEEAQDIINDARQQVKHEISSVQEKIKDKIVDIALDAARAVIQEKLTEDGDRRIVEDFIQEIENTP
ncbi:MAG: F0F1 ATP synthase subunit B [Candidatus Omnitrophica bacterium]|jgi:F-type H+-transporting ATPase subunit b|nr:F0F1 ATP synthase subunit B [Candidatus Omnitrophota bacterium]MDD5725007.1 F0F1 ATP synthase subunit B [Candidatus Omnitrophota bacterium]